MKILFFGNEKLATGSWEPDVPNFKALLDSKHKIGGLVTTPRSNRELNRVESLAKTNRIPNYQPDSLDELKPIISELQPDIGVLAAYGKIIPEDLIAMFPRGIIGIHPSLLPRYRGPTPVEQAILDGIQKTGVSLIKLTKSMDAGPIYSQQEVALEGDVTKPQLANYLAKLGSELLIANLKAIANDQINPKEQNENEATYTGFIKKDDGIIDWEQSAARIEREVRAYLDWPGSRTELFGVEVIITQAQVATNELYIPEQTPGTALTTDDHQLVVACGEDALLIEQLKPAGKQVMSGSEFLNGYDN